MAAGQDQCADIEGPLGAEVDAFIEQRGPHLGRGHVDEPVAVQHVEDRLLLVDAQGTRLAPLAQRDRRRPLAWRADAVPPACDALTATHASRTPIRPASSTTSSEPGPNLSRHSRSSRLRAERIGKAMQDNVTHSG
jgi:hypothetical protein